jgi:hypothetical protein
MTRLMVFLGVLLGFVLALVLFSYKSLPISNTKFDLHSTETAYEKRTELIHELTAPKEKVAEKKVVSQVVDIEETKPISELVDMYEENNKAEEYEKSIMFEKKPSLWQKFKKSKFARAISYVFKIRIRIELPNALPEGRGE